MQYAYTFTGKHWQKCIYLKFCVLFLGNITALWRCYVCYHHGVLCLCVYHCIPYVIIGYSCWKGQSWWTLVMWAANVVISTLYSNKQILITQTGWNINIIRFIDNQRQQIMFKKSNCFCVAKTSGLCLKRNKPTVHWNKKCDNSAW